MPGLFARNERVVCVFEGEFGPFVLVLVGATIVGSMATVWHGVVNPQRPGTLRDWDYRRETSTSTVAMKWAISAAAPPSCCSCPQAICNSLPTGRPPALCAWAKPWRSRASAPLLQRTRRFPTPSAAPAYAAAALYALDRLSTQRVAAAAYIGLHGPALSAKPSPSQQRKESPCPLFCSRCGKPYSEHDPSCLVHRLAQQALPSPWRKKRPFPMPPQSQRITNPMRPNRAHP